MTPSTLFQRRVTRKVFGITRAGMGVLPLDQGDGQA
jgi:hypothetical protein